MDLTVRDAWQTDGEDVVRIHESLRLDSQGRAIENGTVCKLSVADKIEHYVEIRGHGKFCDLVNRGYIGAHQTELQRIYGELHEAPHNLDYIEKHEEEQNKVVSYYKDSIFMNDALRNKFHVEVDNSYQVNIDEAGMFGAWRLKYTRLDPYAKLGVWVGLVSLALAVLGYSLKDWIAAFSTQS